MSRWMPALLALLWLAAPPLQARERFDHGRFEDVALYRPDGATRGVVLLLSGADGWNAHADGLAQRLSGDGLLVAGIDWPRLRAALHADGGDCALPDGDLENFSHWLQGYVRLPGYLPPVLVGEGDSAPLAYAMAALAEPDVFAGAVSLGFVPSLDMGKPPCRGAGTVFDTPAAGARVALRPVPTLATPWLLLQGGEDARFPPEQARRFAAAIDGAAVAELPGVAHTLAPDRWWPRLSAAVSALSRRAAGRAPPVDAGLAGLPLVDVPAQQAGDTFAILLSGDGGWAGLDKEVAAALAARGVPVVGFDSLRYFWQARTPQGLADDLDRIIAHYAVRWQRPKVLLIGYSQGADVLPFALNRLSPDARARVERSVLMGLGQRAAFEFHLGNWIGRERDDTLPILPEARRLEAARTLCIRGEDEDASLCPSLAPAHARQLVLPGGHHFDGDYAHLADAILAPPQP